jgi:formylglycine-generating enzyme required for sulfatase activity
MHIAAILVWALTLTLFGTDAGHAEKRVALVIGNAAYRAMPALQNPRNDAADVGTALRDLAFETVIATDLDRGGMNEALGRFARAAADADIAIIYYSGHGMQYAGTNYLLPVDARLDSMSDVNRFRLVPVEDVLETVRSVRGARVLILDACRNNPAEDELKRRLASVAGANRDAFLTRGLARVSANGLVVAYATQANDVASDGLARNSPFTAAFIKHVGTPDLDLRQMLFRVQDEVDAATKHKQRPELSISLVGEFKLKVVVNVSVEAAKPVRPPALDPAAQAWTATKDTTSQLVLEEFILRFGDSYYAALARARLEELKKAQVAMAPPAQPSPGPAPQPNAAVAAVAPPVVPLAPPEPCGSGAVTASLSARAACPLSAAEERALRPKDVFKECDKCPEMVVVPAGYFMMGSPESEEDRGRNEGPQHYVNFERDFAVGRFAVTYDEWYACVADGGCTDRPDRNSAIRGRRPVVDVSWSEAKTYLAWLSRKTGRSYRLLSEAEREYVTRAGTWTPFWWGKSISTDRANYDGAFTYGGGPKGESRGETLPVDHFRPNPWGLNQVHGNIDEWVEDCWHDSYVGAPANGSAWTEDCGFRTIRGGPWFNPPRELRAAARRGWDAGGRAHFIGFRVARTLLQDAASGPPPSTNTTVAAVAPAVAPAAPSVACGTAAITASLSTRPPCPLSAAEERALKPTDVFKECNKCPEMVVVPAGSFMMGSPRSEPERFDDEGPEHRVTIARQLAVGRFAVTFDEWDACRADGGCNDYAPYDEGWRRGRQPVINVSWNDAQAYLTWLSRKTGRAYRLLSEAEREYVTRAGTTTPFWWGDSVWTSQANYEADANGAAGEYRHRTLPVDGFAPNPWGLYQVHGNVWEWVEDCWHYDYAGAPSNGSAWTPADCSRRVLRGGGWYNEPRALRAAARVGDDAARRSNGYGFRVARTLAP